ncbi:MAG: IS481 family transposase [Lysobacteraceae bacterium]|nr:MAG: IS481 family transposase [Xanthomonadaceae bacterium]
MPWKEKSVKDQREEFVLLARTPGANIAQLSQRFLISRQTAYKWLRRYDPRLADSGLADRSRRPLSSPVRSQALVEEQVLALRAQEGWGARKIAAVLKREQQLQVAPSTAHSILLRHGAISEEASQAATPWKRFEHEAPNDLWQIDFKGHFALGQGRCHALTAIDDHSRYNLVLKALKQETREDVQKALEEAFRRYGMPRQINADNGPPWGSHVRLPGRRPLTQLGVWLIRLGIDLTHSRPAHPQTNGKDERFHRTLKAELLARRHLADMPHAQQEFDIYRHKYNYRRPHEALQMKTPSQRYKSSRRAYPDKLAAIEYLSSDWVRKVDESGWLSFKNQPIKTGKALSGYPVAIRPDPLDEEQWQVFFCHARIATFKLNSKKSL